MSTNNSIEVNVEIPEQVIINVGEGGGGGGSDNGGCFNIILAMIVIGWLINYCSSSCGRDDHPIPSPPDTQEQLDVSPPTPDVIERDHHKQYEEEKPKKEEILPTFEDCEGYSDSLKQRMNCPEKVISKKIKGRGKKSAQSKKSDHRNKQPKKQAKRKAIVSPAPELTIGREQFPIGAIFMDNKGCSYKVVKSGDPNHPFGYPDNRAASIDEAFQKHYIKKYKTEQCPYDPRMEN